MDIRKLGEQSCRGRLRHRFDQAAGRAPDFFGEELTNPGVIGGFAQLVGSASLSGIDIQPGVDTKRPAQRLLFGRDAMTSIDEQSLNEDSIHTSSVLPGADKV